jgi:hypothetical protein
LNNRFQQAKDKISKSEGKAIEIMRKMSRTRGTWEMASNMHNVCIKGVSSKGKEKEEEDEENVTERMAKDANLIIKAQAEKLNSCQSGERAVTRVVSLVLPLGWGFSECPGWLRSSVLEHLLTLFEPHGPMTCDSLTVLSSRGCSGYRSVTN